MVLSAYSFGLHGGNSPFARTGCDGYGQQECCFPLFMGARTPVGVTADTVKNRGIGSGDSKRDLQRHRLGHGMSPVIDIQLFQDFLDVIFDGKRADMK